MNPLQKDTPPPLKIENLPVYDTKLHPVVKFRIWDLVEWWVSLHCHYSRVHSDPYPSHHNGLFSQRGRSLSVWHLSRCRVALTHLTIMDSSHREISLSERQITIGLTPLRVSGSTSAGRVICGTDLAECVSVPGDFLRPLGAFPPGFYLIREGWVNRPAPEAPLIRGMPTGP